MTPEAELVATLMGRVKTLVTTPALPVLYREQPVSNKPEAYIEVDHLPNQSDRRYLAGGRLDRAGILQLTLCLPIGNFEIWHRERAGQVAAHFPADLRLVQGSTTVVIVKTDVGRGLPDGGHWRTVVSVYYRVWG
jgi:hypothetical protein